MKKHSSTIFLIGMFLTGLSVLLYPMVSDYWNSRVQTKVIADYDSAVKNMSSEEYDVLFAEADAYNESVRNMDNPLMSYVNRNVYESILNPDDTGVIGYLDIDRIKLEIPVYHGASPEVLNIAAGHIMGSSLPVGGPGTHAIISAHRGLPSARLFTDLDKLAEGDIFSITVLDRVIHYEVDQILIVEPDEVENLRIEDGMDYCTLVTCTPYGINTHRLLVRGHRTESDSANLKMLVPNEAMRIDPLIVTPVVAFPMLLILFAVLMIKYRKK